MKYAIGIILLIVIQIPAFNQSLDSPCSTKSIIERHLKINLDIEDELKKSEELLQQNIIDLKSSELKRMESYTIPVVMHVFHFGDVGKMEMDQALSGLEILNQDFNGLNDGWDTIDSEFDSIKGTLDINFCLATIDPEGNPTTGVIYHEDQEAMLNQGDLFQHAWDNYKYLNIYFPKYTNGAPSDFTAYAYFPSTFGSNNNSGGIFYSSIRWGYGNDSELDVGDDWASVCSHEAGHWLNLRHTFEGDCSQGDLVEDTPPTTGGTIELEGCYNNDFSCGVATNGSNFMDYNHRCKKMFTEGQIERMEAALFLPSRITLWDEANLIATGCLELDTSTDDEDFKNEVIVYPNPASDYLVFEMNELDSQLKIYNSRGQIFFNDFFLQKENQIDVSQYSKGIYFYSIRSAGKIKTGKFIVIN